MVEHVFPIPKGDLYKLLQSLSIKAIQGSDTDLDLDMKLNPKSSISSSTIGSKLVHAAHIKGVFIQPVESVQSKTQMDSYGSTTTSSVKSSTSATVSINDIPIPIDMEEFCQYTTKPNQYPLYLHLTELHIQELIDVIEEHNGCISMNELQTVLKQGLCMCI